MNKDFRRRIAAAALTILLGAFLPTGCAHKQPIPVIGSTTTVPTTSTVVPTEPAVKTEHISLSRETDGDVTIEYPQLSGLADAAMQQTVNQLLREDALSVRSRYSSEGATIEAVGRVVDNRAPLLSVVYTGHYVASGSPYPISLLYASTIDVAQGKRVRLSDAVNVDKAAKALQQGKGRMPEGADSAVFADAAEYVRTEEQALLLSQLKAADFAGDGFPDAFSYRQGEETIVISLPVPHAVGDHAEFVFMLADLV